MSGSRGEANFVWRCKNCKVDTPPSRHVPDEFTKACVAQRESSATIKAAPAGYEQAEPANAQKILEFDCRGLEFTEFIPEVRHETSSVTEAQRTNLPSFQGEWLVDGLESMTKFTGVELGEGEWFDYDEKAGDEVSIKELKWGINRA